MTYQALNQFNIAIEPRYTSIQHRLQYNETVSVGTTEKYITSRLDQETLSAALRLNYALSPNLSIQYYAEPYISIGSYKDFSYVVNPLARTQQEQLYFFDQKQLSMDGAKHQFLVDENKDGIADYQFADPNFAFTQFRSNLVLRWEYFPGSELFLVWSQGMTDYTISNFGIREGIDRQLFQKQAENTFLMKLTYRFIRE